MTSSINPTLAPQTAPVTLPVDPARAWLSAREEPGVCFAVTGAPIECGEARHLGGGDWLFATRLRGRVTDVQPTSMTIDQDGVRVRAQFLLPPGVGLETLAGRHVTIDIQQTLRRGAVPAVDATIRDSRGRLLMWAHDGVIPRDRTSTGVALRVSHAADGAPRLALAGPRRVTTVAPRQVGHVDLGDATFIALVFRVGGDDAAFVLVRR